MKAIVHRIEKVLKSGTSKTGNAYSLDFTNVATSVPVNEAEVFGSKEMVYQYGAASNFSKLDALRGKLPCEVEIDLGVEMDSYGNPKTVITDVKLPSGATNAVKS